MASLRTEVIKISFSFEQLEDYETKRELEAKILNHFPEILGAYIEDLEIEGID